MTFPVAASRAKASKDPEGGKKTVWPSAEREGDAMAHPVVFSRHSSVKEPVRVRVRGGVGVRFRFRFGFRFRVGFRVSEEREKDAMAHPVVFSRHTSVKEPVRVGVRVEVRVRVGARVRVRVRVRVAVATAPSKNLSGLGLGLELGLWFLCFSCWG